MHDVDDHRSESTLPISSQAWASSGARYSQGFPHSTLGPSLERSLHSATDARPKKYCRFIQRCPVRNCRNRIESLPMVGGGLDYSAPFQRAIELIGKRWTGAVVKALIPAPARFNQLLSGIPGISDRVLTERLPELETEGIVERLVDPGPPVRVSYRLTSRGRALEPVLAAVSGGAEGRLAAAAAALGWGPRPPPLHTPPPARPPPPCLAGPYPPPPAHLDRA